MTKEDGGGGETFLDLSDDMSRCWKLLQRRGSQDSGIFFLASGDRAAAIRTLT